MNMTRKQFLGNLAAGTVVLLLEGCGGGGGDGYSGGTPPPPASTCGAASITDNHGHTLTIQKTDLDSMTAKTYSIQGVGDHSHTITLTPTQLAQLKAGSMVTVTSSTTASSTIAAHSHDVTVSCA